MFSPASKNIALPVMTLPMRADVTDKKTAALAVASHMNKVRA
jgi:hypothetical protein